MSPRGGSTHFSVRKGAFIGVCVLFAAITTSSPVSAAPGDFVSVRLIHAYSPASGQAVPLTICVDGAKLADLTTAMRGGPFSLAQGPHQVVAVPTSADCATGTPVIQATITLGDVPSATVMLGRSAQGGSVTVFAKSNSCIPAGQARVTIRNGGITNALPLVAGISADSTARAALTVGAAHGAQAASLVHAGTYGDVAVTSGGVDLQSFGEAEFPAGTDTQFYVYGGADGAPGAFTFTFPATTCRPTTTVPGQPPATLPGQPLIPRVPVTTTPRTVEPELTQARPATPQAIDSEPTYTG